MPATARGPQPLLEMQVTLTRSVLKRIRANLYETWMRSAAPVRRRQKGKLGPQANDHTSGCIEAHVPL